MGLVAATGILIDLTAGGDTEGAERYARDFDRINEILREEELPTFEEPRYGFDAVEYEMAGYTTLHHLRRIAAYRALGHPLPKPWTAGADDEVVEDYYDRAERQEDVALAFEHLMVHSDAEGYYVPVPMPRPVVLEADDGLAGMALGSSVALLEDLDELARALEIPDDLDPEDVQLHDALQGKGGDAPWQRHGGASFACVRLRVVAKASVANRSALVFL